MKLKSLLFLTSFFYPFKILLYVYYTILQKSVNLHIKKIAVLEITSKAAIFSISLSYLVIVSEQV